MEEVAKNLGELYDDLAKIQADAKIQDLDEKYLGARASFDVYTPMHATPDRCMLQRLLRQQKEFAKKCEAVKRQSLVCKFAADTSQPCVASRIQRP